MRVGRSTAFPGPRLSQGGDEVSPESGARAGPVLSEPGQSCRSRASPVGGAASPEYGARSCQCSTERPPHSPLKQGLDQILDPLHRPGTFGLIRREHGRKAQLAGSLHPVLQLGDGADFPGK